MQNRIIKVNNINTRYWEAGSNNSNTPLIFIHGLGGSVENWEKNINALAKDRKVYAFDLVGFGHTDRPDLDYGVALQSQFTLDFLDAMNIDQCVLAGHSLGGAIAMDIHRLDAERIKKLVLVSSAGFGKDISLFLRLLTLPILGKLILGKHSKKNIRRSFNNVIHDNELVTDELIDAISTQPDPRPAILSTLKQTTNIFGLKTKYYDAFLQRMSKIDIPVLLCWGKQDRVTPVSHAETALKNLNKARLHLLENCGHFPQYEFPKEFNQWVHEFVEE